jgi:hypothetical protein
MIVKTLPQFDKSHAITVAKLYEHYINQWVRREEEKKRLLVPEKGKWYAGFLEAEIKIIAGNNHFHSKTLIHVSH